MSYWIIQVLRGVYSAYGPYRTKKGAEHRYEKTKGGEIHLWESWLDGEEDHEKVIDEFKASQYEKSGG